VRRRRLPARRGNETTALVKREATSDLKHLEQVVTIRFPVRSARTYLQRAIGNSITLRLVEARRGEPVGIVRTVEVKHANGGERTFIHGDRVLSNGEPASFFVPDHLVSLKARVEGAARVSKSLTLEDEIVLYVPIRGLLRFLPAVFQGEGAVSSRDIHRSRDTAIAKWGGGLPEEQYSEWKLDEDPIRRFMFIFQHMLTTVTERIERIVDLTDPLLCDAKFLPWLASWVGFELDESLPVHQQRELVRRAIRLYRTRGTRAGIEEMVRVLTSAPVRIRERQKAGAAVLGKAVLVGGQDAVERYQRAEPPGAYLFEPKGRASTSFFTLMLEPRDRFRGRFGERASGVLKRIVHVVSQERPVHVAFTIQFDDRQVS
jgi:phage tail-like protein